ncbi:putative defensin-like protein 83 [Capsella rubella]|uniref:putative defensin-like protein 83 n=1 Tax=Capsella rubella TaxID=81985 RepID=UPI000CD53954|nr:putative defensin-like protein 83 [Capsella rubella]
MMTNKFSSCLLFSLMVLVLILLPIISGQRIPCLPGKCTDSMKCNATCKSKGYKGGACVRMDVHSKTGACCCKVRFESQDSSHTNVLITN